MKLGSESVMTNGTKEDGLREQAVRTLNGITSKNHRLKLTTRQPLRGISAFERLRAEWICANPSHTEAELMGACVVFARACGLILLNQLRRGQHHGEAEKTP